MAKKSEIKFKIATEKWEYDAIHKLNYQTFVDELPQHKPNCRKKLIDKFNKENAYFISIKDNKVIGMISVRDRRPFLWIKNWIVLIRISQILIQLARFGYYLSIEVKGKREYFRDCFFT